MAPMVSPGNSGPLFIQPCWGQVAGQPLPAGWAKPWARSIPEFRPSPTKRFASSLESPTLGAGDGRRGSRENVLAEVK